MWHTLLREAVRAPSGDNTQPWRFELDADGRCLRFFVDPTRDPSPMNSGQRMARIAVGAALENLLRTVRHNGCEVTLESDPEPALAAVRLDQPVAGTVRADPLIARRVTNRRPYDGRPMPVEILAALTRHTPELLGVKTCWITDRQRLTELGALIGQADALMFGEPSMRNAFLSQVRFDAPANAPVEQGLPLGALEASLKDRLALRTMRHLPDWLLKVGGALRVFAAKARQLVESASGLCLVSAPEGSDEQADLQVGRAMQRAWLELTAQGIAAQPMMSLAVLENLLDHASPSLAASLWEDRLQELRQQFRKMVPEAGRDRLGFLLRIGWAAAPTARTGRILLTLPGGGTFQLHRSHVACQ